MSANWLTPRKAAEYCGLHYHTFISLAIKEGLRPDGYAGRSKRYLPATLDRWLQTMRDRVEQGAAS